MCYDSNAQPPDAPGATGTAFGEDVVLTAADNTQFAAYYARPDQPSGAQIIIYPDVRGLHQFYKDLAARFAEAGIASSTRCKATALTRPSRAAFWRRPRRCAASRKPISAPVFWPTTMPPWRRASGGGWPPATAECASSATSPGW